MSPNKEKFNRTNCKTINITYLCVCATALAACEICYQLYPNILFPVHFMLKAGETICQTEVFSETSSTTNADLDEKKDGAFPDIVGNTDLNDII